MEQRVRQSRLKFPLTIFGLFMLAAIWLAIGRVVFGVMGWMLFITLFVGGPLVFMYGLILAIIVAVRQKRYHYRKWGPFMISIVVTLLLVGLVGFFIPDFGDTEDSIGSGLSALLMDRTNAGLVAASGVLTTISVGLLAISAIVTLALAFAEGKRPEHRRS